MTTSFALEVAAPTPNPDRLAPWTAPYSTEDVVVSATFWATFQGLSAFVHVVVVVGSLIGTLLPIPFLAATCSPVKQLPKPPVSVELAFVKAPEPPKPPPPPPPEPTAVDEHADANANADAARARSEGHMARIEAMDIAVFAALSPGPLDDTCTRDADCGAGKHCVSGSCVVKKNKKKLDKRARRDIAELGLIGLLRSDDAAANVLVGRVDDHALGSMKGADIGDAFGSGGLGIATGRGGAVIGFGAGGTIGHGEHRVTLTLGGVNEALRARFERRLGVCHLTTAVRGTVHKQGGVTSAPKNACVERMLARAVDDIAADAAYEVTPAPEE